MRKVLYLLTILSIGCSQPIPKKSAFDNYLISLDTIQLPFKTSSSNSVFSQSSLKYDTVGFNRFKHSWATKPFGIIFNNNNYVVTADVSMGDNGLVPLLVSFDKNGTKLDSLAPYEKSGSDQGFLATEQLIIDRDRSIVIIDTSKRWIEDKKGEVIAGSERKSSDTVFYILSKKGRFVKTKVKHNPSIK